MFYPGREASDVWYLCGAIAAHKVYACFSFLIIIVCHPVNFIYAKRTIAARHCLLPWDGSSQCVLFSLYTSYNFFKVTIN